MSIAPKIVLATAALTLAACGSSAGSTVDDTDTIPPPPGVETAETTPEGEPDWVGEAVNPFDVHLGECINRYEWSENDNRVDLTTIVSCEGAHDREVFFETDFPAEAGAPYPGRDPIEEFARTTCYGAFESFVGVAFEVSDLEITFTVPPEENFTDPQARYRGVVCYLYDPGGRPLSGSARGTRR
ncbi:MAG: septum formation family protein [Acidimicrobiia bacterium]|nr:septum formation family protein [Acidimicrobiia bacterium]